MLKIRYLYSTPRALQESLREWCIAVPDIWFTLPIPSKTSSSIEKMMCIGVPPISDGSLATLTSSTAH